MKTSLVITVLNEEQHIIDLLNSIKVQTQKPNEIIIVDGGSSDKTLSIIKNTKLHCFVYTKKGNRSVGRNYGIKQATGDVILITDAGCILEKSWVKNIIKPFSDKTVDVVAGYYKGLAKSDFQKALIPYVLVMPDKIDPKTFLPASRSMAFTKKTWQKVGGFPNEFSHNEDYVFANRLKKIGVKIVFVQNAIVFWIPRNTFQEAFTMFYRFAYGDAESGLFRPKVFLLFIRTLPFLYLLLFLLIFKSSIIAVWLACLGIVYIVWSVGKNYRYVGGITALVLLPLIQFTADVAVILGTIKGLIKRNQQNELH